MRVVITAWIGYLSAAAITTYFAVLLALNGHETQQMTWRALADHWNRFDAHTFYLPIAEHGYTRLADAGFFPLYPALVHILWIPTGSKHLVGAALTISILGALAALAGVAALARQMNIPTPLVLLLTMTASSVTFFLLAPYPTSLLVACLSWSLYCARAGNWYEAAGIAFFAPLIHATGLVLWPALLVEFIWQHRQNWRTINRLTLGAQAAFVLLTVPDGLGLWCWYCQIKWHDPLAWLHTQQHIFGHVISWPWQIVGLLIQAWQRYPTISYGQARLLVDLLPLLLSLSLFIWAAIERLQIVIRNSQKLSRIFTTNLYHESLPLSYYVLWALLLYLTIAAPVVGTRFDDTIIGAGRYLLAAVPCTLFLAMKAKEPRYQTGLFLFVAISAALQVVFLSSYLTGGWIV